MSNPNTSSPTETTETNQKSLVELIQDATEGNPDFEALQATLLQAQESLEVHRGNLYSTLESLSLLKDPNLDEIQETGEHLFSELEASLSHLQQYLETQDVNFAFSAGSLAHTTSQKLNHYFRDLRNRQLLAIGPTGIPNYNLILRRYEQWQLHETQNENEGEQAPHDDSAIAFEALRVSNDESQNTDPKTLFSEAIQTERYFCIASLEDLKPLTEDEGYKALYDTFDTHLRCLNRILLVLKEDQVDYEKLYNELGQLESTFNHLSNMIPQVQLKARTKGVADIPDLNFILQTARDILDDRASEDPLLDNLNTFSNEIIQTSKVFEMLLEEDDFDSVMLKEQTQKVLVAFQNLSKALNYMHEYFETRELEHLKDSIQPLEEAAIQLDKESKELERLEEQAQHLVCPKCQEWTPKGRPSCEKCGFKLPNIPAQIQSSINQLNDEGVLFSDDQQPQAEGEETIASNPNVIKVYQAINGVVDGSLPYEDFIKTLTWFDGQVKQALEQEQKSPHSDSDVHEARIEAMNMIFDGLSMVSQFEIDLNNLNVLEEGILVLNDGALLLNRIQDELDKLAKEEANQES